LFHAVLIIFVIITPVVAFIGEGFGVYPFLGFVPVYIGFERRRLGGRNGCGLFQVSKSKLVEFKVAQLLGQTYKGEVTLSGSENWYGWDMICGRATD
jgi:hypothetical protein